MEEVVETAKNLDFTHDDSNDVTILSNENDHVLLYYVLHDEEVIRHRSYICSYGHTYESNSTKDTATKKIAASTAGSESVIIITGYIPVALTILLNIQLCELRLSSINKP
ncbi:hypothetical protein C1646_815562 [Rhizophagus diaphanus]|nr:hypothetical protein C1646_815562 [Rhizophagus diaphanus] [Rhizophagus sp. MUCL 43196]